jgi:hypothetical protein
MNGRGRGGGYSHMQPLPFVEHSVWHTDPSESLGTRFTEMSNNFRIKRSPIRPLHLQKLDIPFDPVSRIVTATSSVLSTQEHLQETCNTPFLSLPCGMTM